MEMVGSQTDIKGKTAVSIGYKVALFWEGSSVEQKESFWSQVTRIKFHFGLTHMEDKNKRTHLKDHLGKFSLWGSEETTLTWEAGVGMSLYIPAQRDVNDNL